MLTLPHLIALAAFIVFGAIGLASMQDALKLICKQLGIEFSMKPISKTDTRYLSNTVLANKWFKA